MRGQYTLTEESVTSGGSGTDVLGLIVPANTIIDINDMEVWGLAAASSPVEFALFIFTGNTPTLSQAITPKGTDSGNALAATLSLGGRGTGAQSVWSATPTSLQAQPVLGGGFNAFGGRWPWNSSLQRRASLGGASAVYATLRQISGASALIGYRFTFSE